MSSSSGQSTPVRDVKCHCNWSAQLQVTRNARNYEKPYFNCAAKKCKFFVWWRDIYPPSHAAAGASSSNDGVECMLLELKNQYACLLSKIEEMKTMKIVFVVVLALLFIWVALV